jgi:hypothetical protein
MKNLTMIAVAVLAFAGCDSDSPVEPSPQSTGEVTISSYNPTLELSFRHLGPEQSIVTVSIVREHKEDWTGASILSWLTGPSVLADPIGRTLEPESVTKLEFAIGDVGTYTAAVTVSHSSDVKKQLDGSVVVTWL